jgi:hypothetical protein
MGKPPVRILVLVREGIDVEYEDEEEYEYE